MQSTLTIYPASQKLGAMTDAQSTTTGPLPTTVAEMMTTPPVTATAGETLASAAERMDAAGVGSVIVVDGNRPVGILTERDLLHAARAGADPSQATVGPFMTPDPDCIDPGTEIAEAWRSLAAHGYRHIPVVVGEELKGVVSLRDLMRLAQLRPVQGAFQDVPKGLEGVVAAETSIGEVRGLEGFYHYRQYSAVELAERRSLEDVWYLLFEGELPDTAQAADFADEVREAAIVPGALAELLPAVAATHAAGGDLDGLRTAVSIAGAVLGLRPVLDLDAAARRQDALRIAALVPVLVAALARLQHGLEPVAARPDLGVAANYLWMVSGSEPSPEHARAVEQYLIATMDHGLNASTFTARVAASTGTDVAAAVVAALSSLSGPLHGGAPSRALDTLDAIGTPDRTPDWVRATVAGGGKMMGFGHRVYRTEDPRSLLMRRVAEGLGGPLVEFAVEVEKAVVDTLAELKPGRHLYANVEFYAGVVMELSGIDRHLFTPTFAVSRAIGWCAHILEQAADNRIIRPSSRYVGPPAPQPVPAR
jgi:citrate synthase